jgi:hypothetical protein
MEIWEEISRQRVKYIVDSYQLDELALVEILIEGWRNFPLIRGVPFLERSHNLLKSWENKTIAPNISATHFRLITGLDPTPIFGIDLTPISRTTFPSIPRR